MIEAMIEKLQGQNRFLSLEITPKLQSSFSLEERDYSFVDAFVCTDSPLARFKPSSIISSLKIQNYFNKPAICTISMRDRNAIALCGDILAINEFGVRAFLSLTGDPIKLGDTQSVGVFEGNSILLSKIISNLNQNIALNGKKIDGAIKKIYNFNVINSYAKTPQNLIKKIERKIEKSDIYALFSQPIYDEASAEFLLENVEKANKKFGKNVKIVFGFFPVTSFKTAVFIKNKLSDVFIPESFLNALENAKDKEAEFEIGIALSKKLLEKLQKMHNKFHFMSATKMSLVGEFFAN